MFQDMPIHKGLVAQIEEDAKRLGQDPIVLMNAAVALGSRILKLSAKAAKAAKAIRPQPIKERVEIPVTAPITSPVPPHLIAALNRPKVAVARPFVETRPIETSAVETRRVPLSGHAQNLVATHHTVSHRERLKTGFQCSKCPDVFYVETQAQMDVIDEKKLKGQKPVCPTCEKRAKDERLEPTG